MINTLFTIDSSVMIASLIKEDKYFAESQNFFRKIFQIQSIQLIMPSLVVLEIFNTFFKNKTKEEKIIKIKNLFDLPVFNWIPLDANFIESFKTHYRPNVLKTSDAIIALTAKIYSTELVTWDKQIIKEAKKIGIKAFTPKDFKF